MNNMDSLEWKNLTQTPDSCSILDIDYTKMATFDSLVDYLKTPLQTLNYTSCSEFEFFSDEHESKTLVQEFGLVCSKRHFLSVVEMCFLAGAAFGSVCSGWLSDRFGRKHILMGFACVQTTFGKLHFPDLLLACLPPSFTHSFRNSHSRSFKRNADLPKETHTKKGQTHFFSP